jgi:tetratricopeptide (TPR) repeat protein
MSVPQERAARSCAALGSLEIVNLSYHKPNLPVAYVVVGCLTITASARCTRHLLAQTAEIPREVVEGHDLLPEPFVPRQLRDEATEDRLRAAALFAEGRLLFRREQFAQALTRYQRAYRYANNSATILSEIIPLAYRLGRLDEAARYARLATDQTEVDPFVWRRLALHLTEQEEFAQALELYQVAASGAENDEAAVPTVITQFEMGRLLYLTDRFADAVTPFEKVRKTLLQPEPHPADKPAVEALLEERQITFSIMAETYLNADRPEQAGELFQLAYKDQPGTAIMDFHLARVAAKRKDASEALERLRRYMQSGDTEAGTAPYELLSQLLDQTQQSDQRLAELQQLAEKQPQNIFLVYYLGQLLLERQDAEQAVRRFQQLMQIRPLLDGYRGLIGARMQQQDAAALIEVLADAVGRLGSLESLSGTLGQVIADKPLMTRLLDTARTKYLSDQTTQPESVRRGVALAMAELLAQADDNTGADEFYQRAVGSGDDADQSAWMAWGLERLASDQPQRAVEVFEGLLARTENREQQGAINYYLAAALALDDRFDAALTAARQAAQLLPNLPAIQLRPAWVLLMAKRWPEAERTYREFLDRFGDQYASPALRDAVREAKTSVSSVCVYQDKLEPAEEWLEQVLDEFPKDVGAHNDLGYLWADRGVHLQRALRMTAYASQAEPTNVAYRDSFGWALYKLGKYDEALTQLRQAAEVDAPDGLILDHLGDVVLKVEGPAAALEIWRRAQQALGDEEPQRRTEIEGKINQQANR